MFDASRFQLLFTFLTGWLDRQERDVVRYLLEENRVLRRRLRGRRVQLTDTIGAVSPCMRINWAVNGCGDRDYRDSGHAASLASAADRPEVDARPTLSEPWGSAN